MLLKPTRRLPRKFNRRVSQTTQKYVERHVRSGTRRSRHYFLRFFRRMQRLAEQSWNAFRRWALLAAFLFILIGFGIVVFSPLIQVREIRVQRSDARVDVRKIQEALAPLFGRHLFFLSNREVVRMVSAALPDLESVSVSKAYPSRLTLHIGLKPLTARLNIDVDPQSKKTAQTGAVLPGASDEAGNVSDFLTANGMYVRAQGTDSGAGLPLIRLVDWAVRPVPQTPLLGQDMLQAMAAAEKALSQEFGLTIRERTVFLRAREFHLRTNQLTLWFDLKSSVDEQLARYRLFLKSGAAKEAKEHIDLRLSSRIVYK